jgi:diaminohydroxyphosphoribosylaminopyrimidine deaminase/5-amino-6-(5-phosphoribosylamino)uracil reductase
MEATDLAFMREALRLAEQGLYSTDPNPRVGCVIVNDGQIVGRGAHLRAGEAHAEVHALREASARARGGTAYVTLEPCAHHGRTPPCCEALIAAGIARVVYAVGDPNPQVGGAGAARLAQAAIRVSHGVLASEARALNRGFLSRFERARPWVCVKLAASLDGRTALANGDSRWITSEAARADVQALRARSSAILTGAASVRRDDSRLTVRDPELPLRGRVPLRVVLDPQLSVSTDAALFRESGPVLLITPSADAARRKALEAVGAEIVELAGRGATGLLPVLAELARRECNEVLVEAGARLAGAFLGAGLVDELVVYLAPILLGPDAAPLAQLPMLERLAGARRFVYQDVRQVGTDLRLTLVPTADGES